MLWHRVRKRAPAGPYNPAEWLFYSGNLDWEGLQTLWGLMSVQMWTFQRVRSSGKLEFKRANVFLIWTFSLKLNFFHILLQRFRLALAVESFSIAWPGSDPSTSHCPELCSCVPACAGFNQRTQWSSSDSHFPISHLKQRGTGHASTFVIQVFFRALTTSQNPIYPVALSKFFWGGKAGARKMTSWQAH